MKLRLKPGIAATVAVLGLVAAGCTSSPKATPESDQSKEEAPVSESGSVTVGYAAGGEWGNYIEAQLERARTEYPELEIKSVVYPTYDDQLNQLPTEFAGKTAPDIIQWDGAAPIAQYVSEGVVESLNEFVTSSGFDAAAYPQSLIDGWTFDGELYGVPLFLQHSGAAYRTDLLEEAGVTEIPSTLAEFSSAAKQVTDNTTASGAVLLDTLFHISQYLYAHGGGYGYGETINSEANIQGLTYLVDLFKDGSMKTASELGATWDGEAFANGLAAMSDAGPWYIGFMATTAPDVPWVLEPLPGVEPGQESVVTYSGGYSINALNGNADAAQKVLGVLTDDTAQKELLASGTQVPAMTAYIDEYRAATPAFENITEELIANGKPLDYPIQTNEFGYDLVMGFQEIIHGSSSESPAELLNRLQEKYGTK